MHREPDDRRLVRATNRDDRVLLQIFVELVGPDRERVSVDSILSDATLMPAALAGLNFLIEFEDGREWEFMVGLTNPQVFEVLP